jgi:type IV pilus assembly protein PilO
MANAKDILSQFQGLSLENVASWPAAPKIVTWLVTIALCAGAGWFFWWSKQVEELNGLQQTETNLKNEYKQKLQQAVNLEELRRQKEQVSQYVLTLEKQLPSKAEMDALLSDINQAGIGRGLQFELFRPGSNSVKEYYAELPIAVKVSGRYHDLGAFASDIANLPRIVTLNNVAIQAAKDGGLTMDATAKTFRYLDEEEVANQRKARAAAQAKK